MDLRSVHDASAQPETCRRPGCRRPRTHLSVFCEEHHREQLERAGSGAELPLKDVLWLMVGPLWLNVARVGAVAAAAVTVDGQIAVAVIGGVSIVSAVVGWRWSRRLVWRAELGFPVAFNPSPMFVVPIVLYSSALAGLVATLTVAAFRAAG